MKGTVLREFASVKDTCILCKVKVKKDGVNQLWQYKRAHSEIATKLEQMKQQAVPREEGTHVLKSMLFDLITQRRNLENRLRYLSFRLVPQFKDKGDTQLRGPRLCCQSSRILAP